MDWNDYWRVVEAINQTGTPKYEVCTYAETSEAAFMELWIEKWYKHCFYLDQDGCGCCYTDYRIDAPQEAIDELYNFEVEIHEFDDTDPGPIKTGVPSNFLEFSKNARPEAVGSAEDDG